MDMTNFKSEEDVKDYIKNLGTEYRFGCFSEKNPEVCHLLGDYLEAISKDFQKAARVYKSNCDDYNYAKSCHKIANYFMSGKGNLTQSQDKALEYYEKGCKLSDMDSCFRSGVLGILNSQSKLPTRSLTQLLPGSIIPSSVLRPIKELCAFGEDAFDTPETHYSLIGQSSKDGVIDPRSCLANKSVAHLTKSCEGNHPDACHHLSSLYMDGSACGTESIVKDMSKAFQYAVKACDLGNIYACVNVSIMYKRGDGVEKNQAESDKYKNIALEKKKEQENKQQQLVFQQGLKPV